MGFWKNVETIRIYKGITRKELAFKANIAYQGIGLGIERDSMPGADTAIKISRVLGIPLDSLMEDADLSINSDNNLKSFNTEKISEKNLLLLNYIEKLPINIKEAITDMIFKIASSED